MMRTHRTSTTASALVFAITTSTAAFAQGTPAGGGAAEDAPLFDAPNGDTPSDAPTAPSPPAEPVAAVASAEPTGDDTTTIHDRGGLFGIGLVIAPKIGGGLGSLFFAGLGPTFTGSLELGYMPPLPAPLGRDFEVFVEAGYAAPSTEEVVDADDPRLADGTFHYRLTLHQLGATWGLLYPIPVPLSWLRPTVALGARTVWSRTIVEGDAGGEAFGATEEDAFDFGAAGSVGADFFVGPGAIAVELQAAWVPAHRYVLRDTSATVVQVVVGYRFML